MLEEGSSITLKKDGDRSQEQEKCFATLSCCHMPSRTQSDCDHLVTTLIAPLKTKTWKQEGGVEKKVMSNREREYKNRSTTHDQNYQKKMKKTIQIEYKLKKLF